MTGTLGDVFFTVNSDRIMTPSDVSGTSGSDWASHDLVHDKPKSEWIGPKLQTYKFKILLRSQDGIYPWKEMKKLQAMAEGNGAYYFILDGTAVGYKPFKVVSADVDWKAVQYGYLTECEMSIELEEYL